jgi:hypothetical protein
LYFKIVKFQNSIDETECPNPKLKIFWVKNFEIF